MKKILVTGGSGFIGSHVVDYLLDIDLSVTVFTRSTNFSRDEVELFLGNVENPGDVVEAVGLCDAVIHLAGLLGTSESILQPMLSVDTNILGSLNVFEACRIHNKKCVNVSVGNYWMNNTYAISKSAAERFALMYNNEFKTNITNVRVFNAYGPRQKPKPVRKLIPNAVLSALANEDITIFGSGNQVIDQIYVEDVARILGQSLFMDVQSDDTIIDAGTGRGMTIKETVQAILKAAGSASKINYSPMRKGEDPDSQVVADVETLKVLDINSRVLTTFEKGIEKTIVWYNSM